jgi:hypothetical protein
VWQNSVFRDTGRVPAFPVRASSATNETAATPPTMLAATITSKGSRAGLCLQAEGNVFSNPIILTSTKVYTNEVPISSVKYCTIYNS